MLKGSFRRRGPAKAGPFLFGGKPCIIPGDRFPELTDRTPAQRPMPPSGLLPPGVFLPAPEDN